MDVPTELLTEAISPNTTLVQITEDQCKVYNKQDKTIYYLNKKEKERKNKKMDASFGMMDKQK